MTALFEKRFTVRLPAAMWAALEQAASDADVSPSEIIRFLVDDWMAEYGNEDPDDE